MRRVTVPLARASYDVVIGAGILVPAVMEYVRRRGGRSPLAIVTDDQVAPLYAQPLAAAGRAELGEAAVVTVVLPAGEASKSFSGLGRLYSEFARAALDRKSLVLAVGGGVVGDLAGFASATYLRGIDVAQVPTTLLAQVDASVGGKTAIDLPEGKNLVGAFHQPRIVVADLSTLSTLPEAQFRSGLAEVIKYGMIAAPAILDLLESRRAAVLERDVRVLEEIVGRSCAIKAGIVAADEREESGEGAGREALNFGHTLGHALEAATGYCHYLHGEAVAIGMVAAAQLSGRILGMEACHQRRLAALLGDYGLPLRPRKPVDVGRLLAAARRDKKARAGTLRFVLTRAPGDVVVEAVSSEVVHEVMEASWK